MDQIIKCPVCGEINSAELDYCQKCNTHLRPQNEAFRPGELPDKKKNTAELEPILPQWLRDAREQSRQTSQDDSIESVRPTQSSTPAKSAAPNVDLLAGLQSHASDDSEDETPDWLASITGVSNKSKKTAETADVHRVEMGGRDDFAQDAESETPSWLASIQSQPKTEKDELTDWFKEASNQSDDNSKDWLGQPTAGNTFINEINEPAISDQSPDWLRQMQADESAKNNPIKAEPSFIANDDGPDWLKGMQPENSAAGELAQTGQSGLSNDDAPDWLKRMGDDQPASASTADAMPSFSSNDELPSWLNSEASQEKSQSQKSNPFSESNVGGNDAPFSLTEDTPDWLKPTPSEQPKTPALRNTSPLKNTSPLWLRETTPGSEAEDVNVPAWLSSDAPVINQPPAIDQLPTPAETKNDEAEFGDIPSWLKAAAPQSSIFSEPAVEPEPAFSSDTPDWLSAFKSVEGSQPASPFETETKNDANLAAPAFTENAFDGGSDALFTEMPDWLANASEDPLANAAPLPPTANNAETLSAGELPSWVQAMRPVESSSSARPTVTSSSDQTLESRGALSGLTGVLPAVPGYTPSSKPKAYSILLQATEEQKSHAFLLEQILSAETEPQPIASFQPLAVSRPLRWFLAVTVFAMVITVTALGTQLFTMPVLSMTSPSALKGALDVAQTVPEGAPVLVVMDYQPSHAAELEAAAAPMFDQMDLLRHPKLVFISTNEMGSILAQRLVSLPSLKDRYQGEGQFTNLGYLPGGELGIRAFVQNPLQAKPSDIFQNPSPLQSISVAQFVAVIVLTDNANSGRVWIEQATAATAPLPFPSPIVLITSAQAGPMIQPYYVSGQVKGIVNGLYGAAIFEQNNAGRPGTARNYWDAYSLGMLLAMSMLALGGLWNLALGVRDRSNLREAKS